MLTIRCALLALFIVACGGDTGHGDARPFQVSSSDGRSGSVSGECFDVDTYETCEQACSPDSTVTTGTYAAVYSNQESCMSNASMYSINVEDIPFDVDSAGQMFDDKGRFLIWRWIPPAGMGRCNCVSR